MTSGDVVLPTDSFFPAEFGQTMAEIEQYGQVIAKYLGVQESVKFEFGEASLVGGPARLVRDQATILIAESELPAPVHVASVMAHEMSRFHLLESELLTGDEPDFESLVDLYPLFCGLGVFAANATGSEPAPEALPRGGYLSSRVLGYALALYAWARGEQQPTWIEYLRVDAAEVLQKSLKYLAKANDVILEPTTAPDKRRWSVSQSLEHLNSKSASHRLGALWYLKGHQDFSKPVSNAIQGCLRDRDVAVRRAAAALAGQLTEPDANFQDDLLDTVRDPDAEVRAHAARAIGTHGFSGPDVELGLEPLLNDGNREVLLSTAMTMAAIGMKNEEFVKQLGKRFKTALVECNFGYAQLLVPPIAEMHGNFEEFARSFFSHDEELLEQAISVAENARDDGEEKG